MVRNAQNSTVAAIAASQVAWLVSHGSPAHQVKLDPVARQLSHEGFSIVRMRPERDLKHRLQSSSPDLIVAFLSWAAQEGVDPLRWANDLGVQVVLIPDPERGVADSLALDRGLQLLTRAASRRGTERSEDVPVAERHEPEPDSFEDLARQNLRLVVGRSQAMHEVYSAVCKAAPTDATVLLVGESGTGKELVSTALHRLSARAAQSLVAVNCGAISPTLIESCLFGHEKGSFTGAHRTHHGFFEQASRGTLFLDEVTEMPLELQVKLLRVLETGTFRRVGGFDDINVDVRIVAATNRCPRAAVRDGSLREDLYYRLQVFPIQIPPLRECKDDLRALCLHFLADFAGDRAPCTLSAEAIGILDGYDWPGNVRELRNVLQRATILAGRGNILGVEHFQLDGPREGLGPQDTTSNDEGCVTVPVGSTIAEGERRLILATLEKFKGDKKKAAEVLGVSFKTVYNRLHAFGVGGRRAF